MMPGEGIGSAPVSWWRSPRAAAFARERTAALLALTLTLVLLLPAAGAAGPARRPGTAAPAATPAADEDEETARRRLESIEAELAAQRRTLERLQAREVSVFEALAESDRALEASRAEVARLGVELVDVRARLAEAVARIETLEAALAGQRAALEARAVALYKLGPLGPLQVLLSASSLPDLARRARYLRAVLEADRAQVAAYEAGRRALIEETAALRREQRALAVLERRQRAMVAKLAAEQAARRTLLATIRKEQALTARVAEELAMAAEGLKELLAKLEAEAVARALAGETQRLPGGFEAARGRLMAPVVGEVVTPFGPREHPRFRTVTVSNGIEIRAPAGTEVRAVYPGRVLYAGWFRGYGKMLILDHGDQFYTLYAHASELYKAVGELVRQGEVVAAVGETGALDGPVLYFEIRQGGKPLDPAEWLAVSEARR